MKKRSDFDYIAAKRQLTETLKIRKLLKEDIMLMFGIDERTARELVSDIAHEYAVPSSSAEKGYYIATDKKDIAAVRRAYLENNSRATDVLKRNEPLKRFMEEVS